MFPLGIRAHRKKRKKIKKSVGPADFFFFIKTKRNNTGKCRGTTPLTYPLNTTKISKLIQKN
jgi:hypothetical protein